MLLQDKIVLITGGSGGIGAAIGRLAVDHGALVVLADLDVDRASAVAAQIGADASGVACDVADEASVATMVDGVIGSHGRLDVLINNAGITRDGMIHRQTLKDFRAVIDVHLQGSWLCSRAAMTHMRQRPGGGSIVNMSSISGKVGNLGQGNYAAAKAGMVGLTKSTAREGARYGIRVNAVQPGLIDTAMTRAMPEDAWMQKLAGIPLGRAGSPEEVASVALFLASDMASYVTGVTVEVAGGRHM